MNTEKLTKSLLIGLLSLGLASCTNTSTPASATENNNPVEAQEFESEDMIATSMEDEANTEEVAKEDATEETTDKEAETKEAEEADAEAKEDPAEEATDSQKADEEEVEVDGGAELASDKKYEEGKGSYVGSLVLQSNGERSDDAPFATVIDLDIVDETLTVKGSLDYRENPEAGEEATELANDTYNFRVDENTVYQAVGGLAEPEYYTVDEFLKFYDEVKDSGLGLIIEMENGLVHTVSVTS